MNWRCVDGIDAVGGLIGINVALGNGAISGAGSAVGRLWVNDFEVEEVEPIVVFGEKNAKLIVVFANELAAIVAVEIANNYFIVDVLPSEIFVEPVDASEVGVDFVIEVVGSFDV